MAYLCEFCGAHLDPGEKCDCKREAEESAKKWQSMTKKDRDGQFRLLPPDKLKERDEK